MTNDLSVLRPHIQPELQSVGEASDSPTACSPITRSVCFTHHRGYGKTRAEFPDVESGKPLSFAMFSDDLSLMPRIGVDFPSFRSIPAHSSSK